MRAINVSNGNELSGNVVAAECLWNRMKGLIGRDYLEKGESLWIRPCNSVHTVGMKFPIDILFLDLENRVIGVSERMPPNRLSRIFFKARSVLELPAGALSASVTEVGHRIDFLIRES
jgi:uncharacterized membrane protein (UPF0127 family)